MEVINEILKFYEGYTKHIDSLKRNDKIEVRHFHRNHIRNAEIIRVYKNRMGQVTKIRVSYEYKDIFDVWFKEEDTADLLRPHKGNLFLIYKGISHDIIHDTIAKHLDRIKQGKISTAHKYQLVSILNRINKEV